MIRKVGIIGAGTMGSGIAAHLANCDIPVVLLDIVTPNLGPAEQADPAARNRLVQTLFDRMVNGRPVQLATPERANMIQIGNTSDHFELLADCDWVIEVIIEKLAPKQALLDRLEQVCKADAIITSNTSGIPIKDIAAESSPDVKRRFLGTHFFNPPRYLKLLEVIPTAETDPAIVETICRFGRETLGKGVVICKDTPNFIANRFGAVTGSFVAETTIGNGYSVADTDALLGPLIGRPRTGYFRLADLVGLDIRCNVLDNLYDAIPHDPYRELLQGKSFRPVYNKMLANGWLGNKAGQGFIKKVMVDGQRQFWTLDTNDFEYKHSQLTNYPSVAAFGEERDLVTRIKKLLSGDDRGATLVRQVLFNVFEYAAYVTPEIAYSLADVDNTVRWGFNYQIGPFELWNALGVAEIAARMEVEGFKVAGWVQEMLASGHEGFYGSAGVYDFMAGQFTAQPTDPRHFSINTLRQRSEPIASNESASLHDMGDGILLFEFHSKANTLDIDIFDLGRHSLELLANKYDAMVIGNEGRHFSAGARMSKSFNSDDHDVVTRWIRQGQQFMMDLRHAAKPVVAALHGKALGGGAEISMQSWHSVAAFDFQVGLVEFNVGRVPGWTGVKELMRRCVNPVARAGGNPLPVLRRLLTQLMDATVSTTAWQAKELGYLRPTDTIVMNEDHRLLVAKESALELAGQSLDPPPLETIYAAGQSVREQLLIELDENLQSGGLTEFDALIGEQLIRILTGGATVEASWVDPWHILDLEIAGSLAVRFDERSIARMNHMLKTGKPLRN